MRSDTRLASRYILYTLYTGLAFTAVGLALAFTDLGVDSVLFTLGPYDIRSQSIVEIGLTMMIFSPLVGAGSLFAIFLCRKDWKYALTTLTVLGLVALALVQGLL
ncbi:MAG: hypothetical protein AB7E27_03290 [Candidatus Methanomethylophilaceae archaeon]